MNDSSAKTVPFDCITLYLIKIGVTIVDDNQWEPDEEFFLKLSHVQGDDSDSVKLGRTSIMEIMILNDDGQSNIRKIILIIALYSFLVNIVSFR